MFLNMFGYKLQFITLMIFNYKLFCCYCCCRDEFINDDVYKNYKEETSSKEVDSNKMQQKEDKFIELLKINHGISDKVIYNVPSMERYINDLKYDLKIYITDKSLDDKEIENKDISTYCYNLAIVSRLAYSYVRKFLANKDKEQIENIANSFKKEHKIKNEIKDSEYVVIMEKLCKEREVKFLDPVDKDKINEYFHRLIDMYLLCLIFELEVDFSISDNNDFDNDTMQDQYTCITQKKKVNFTILPSLSHRGSRLLCKKEVFTYIPKGGNKKETFFFDKEKVEKLDKILID